MLNMLSGGASDRYFLRRYIEEVVLAATADTAHERAVHEEASRHFGDILGMNSDGYAEERTRS